MKIAPFILLLAFAAIVIFIGYFMWSHRNRDFWLLAPTTTPSLAKILQYYGIFLILMGLATLIATLLQAVLPAVLLMIIDSFAIAALSLLMLVYSKF